MSASNERIRAIRRSVAHAQAYKIGIFIIILQKGRLYVARRVPMTDNLSEVSLTNQQPRLIRQPVSGLRRWRLAITTKFSF